MSFWVARSRQKPPEENAFAQRAKRLRRGQKPEPQAAPEPVSAPEKTPEPSEVADAMPDLQALREAAEKAAALVHSEEAKAADELSALGQEIQPETDQGKAKRGRPQSAAVKERNARILEIVKKSEQVGISKPDIAELLGEKEQQVYTSLRQLQAEGLVESKYLDGLGYRWLAL
jgi:multidrug efflux pump subunit AcrB